jgi:hypothetical protein
MPIENIVTDTISNYKAELGSGSKQNLYRIKIENLPAQVLADIGADAQTIETQISRLCHATSMPKERAIESQSIPYFGAYTKIASTRPEPDEWTFTFRNTEDHLLRRFFEAWLSYIHANTSGVQTTPELHNAVAYAGQLDGGKNLVYQKRMDFFKPSDVAAIEYSQDGGEITETEITGVYDNLTTVV